MAHESIFSILESHYNVNDEISVIDELLTNGQVTYNPRNSPFAMDYNVEKISVLIGSIFCKWKGRGTAASLAIFRKRIGIDTIIDKLRKSKDITDSEVITYLEYAMNISRLFIKYYQSFKADYSKFDIAYTNLLNLIEKMNLSTIWNDKFDGIELIIQNPEAILVAESLPTDVGIQVLQYHHHLLKGDLAKKRAILYEMNHEFEPIRKKLESKGFKQLATDTGFCLNRFNIRHNNEKEQIASSIKEEIEDWYDYTYQLLILCFSTEKYLSTRERINILKRNII